MKRKSAAITNITSLQIDIVAFQIQIDSKALRLYGLPEAGPAVLNGVPLLTGALFGSGRREFAVEVF